MGAFVDAYLELVGEINDLGLQATADPRNLRPPMVIIDPPSIQDVNGQIFTLSFSVVCVAPPPANLDAIKTILDMADTIVEALPATTGNPQIYTVGEVDLPAYNLTLTKTIRR